MSRTRYKIYETEFPYFMTCTIVGWLPLFTRPWAVEVVFDSWRYLQSERSLRLFGYVILENHLHFIASAPDLVSATKSFKSFTARQIVNLLKRHSEDTILHQMRAHKLKHKKESDFQVWQEGMHPQQISTDDIMWQKLAYIHDNPVKRGYVDDPLHWRYSSARNYTRQPALVDVVTDWV